MANYTMLGVKASGLVVGPSPKIGKPPTVTHMCRWGKPLGADAVIRYFPSKKGWAVYDIRSARSLQGVQQRNVWTNAPRFPQIVGSEDGAIMYAIHMLAR